MRNKKILVTGGSGFIGSRLVERLVRLGVTPTLILRKNCDKERLNSLLDEVEIYEADIINNTGVKQIVKIVKPQIIFHLASSGVDTYTDFSYKNTSLILDTNIKGTINLLYAACEENCEIFINTGSCFEYGNKKTSFIEDSNLSPCNIYGISKVTTTLLSKVFNNNTDMAIVTLRPFTTYGPGENSCRFISTTIRHCLNGKNPKLTTKRIIRDYIFIEDVIDAYLLTAKSGKKLSGEVINISTGKGIDLESVGKLIIKLTGAKGLKAEVGTFPERKGEVISLIGNPEKAKRLLKWQAQYSLEEGIKKTINWIKTTN